MAVIMRRLVGRALRWGGLGGHRRQACRAGQVLQPGSAVADAFSANPGQPGFASRIAEMAMTGREAKAQADSFGGGAVPWAHFSILPRTPHAAIAREMGSANWLRPGIAVTTVPNSPANPPEPGVAVTAESTLVISAPPNPSAVFLPFWRLPMVSPSAPLTCPSSGLASLPKIVLMRS